MNQEVEKCEKNPHGKGHCDHTEMFSNEQGVHMHHRCCWCNRAYTSFLQLPEHGRFAPAHLKSQL